MRTEVILMNFETQMTKELYTNGSVVVWYPGELNNLIFDPGENYIWKKFKFSGKECSIISEGNRISAVLELGSYKEKTIISASIPKSKKSNLHSLILQWENNIISLYMDSTYLKQVVL